MQRGASINTGPLAAAASVAVQAIVSAPSPTSFILWQNRSTGERGFWSMVNRTYQGDWIPLVTTSTSWNIAAIADFTGDLKPDLLWQNTSTGEIGIWPMNGVTWTGQWIPVATVPLGWQVAAAGDLTEDGKPDIVLQNTTTGERGFWPMNGTERTGEYFLLYPDNISTAWEIAAAADFTEDLRADLVWQNKQTQERGFWPMDNGTWTGDWVPTLSQSADWDIATVADMTGGDAPDFVWQNTTTGERGFWQFFGMTKTGPYIPLSSVPIEWDIAGVLVPVRAVANAGPDQDKNKGQSTTLDGSGSTAPAGTTYTWTQISGPDVTRGAGTLTGVHPVFTAPSTVSTLEFDLQISNAGVVSAPDRVTIFIFEDKAHTFFVSAAGSDEFGFGTRSFPVQTINKAIQLAAAQGLGGDVYVASKGLDCYEETISLAPNVSLYGGYSSTWIRNRSLFNTCLLAGGDVTIVGTTISKVTIDGFSVSTVFGNVPNGSHIGISLDRPGIGVVVSNNDISAGTGGSGTDGVAGQFFGNGTNGANGAPGTVSGGGAPGSSPMTGISGGNGGPGGFGSFGGLAGAQGQQRDGGPGGAGGPGGTSGNPGLPGGAGLAGATGSSGSPGANGTSLGFFSGVLYIPSNGGFGTSGVNGSGGGGGGGGGGLNCSGCSGGGGGGGAGGQGGALGGYGLPATGGGGSFGVVLINPSAVVTVSGNTITSRTGGNGGNGGSGARGGLGGSGGSGGTGYLAAGSGAAGGRGGNGGSGGGGGGGGGGPSLGILQVGLTFPVKSVDNVFNIGSPGTGGLNGNGVAASNGLTGTVIVR